ncbi:50S ribosomal protein L9 [bacterium]|jgi:large subunit ribosomal protein L9|nr:50S ribosomal protein L9 [bacterium]
MDVILIKDMKQKGRLGDTLQVKTGYARNYLIPNGFAIIATPENESRFKTLKRKEEKRLLSQRSEFEKVAADLNGKTIEIEAQTHKGRLYGSITPADIAKAIAEQLKQTVSKSDLDMPAHVKEIGEHKISICLHPDLECVITLTITSNSEVDEPTDFYETEEGEQVAEQAEIEKTEQAERVKAASEAQAEEEATAETEETDPVEA